MNIEQELKELEISFGSIPGTILSRVLHPDKGVRWCLGIGRLGMPKDFYYGDTIEEVIHNAKNNIGKELSWDDLNKFIPNFNKMPADGFCGACGKEIPKTAANKFYCRGACENEAWAYHHPVAEEKESLSIPFINE